MTLDQLVEKAALDNKTNAEAKVKKDNIDSIIHKLNSLGFITETEEVDTECVSLKVKW